MGHRRFHAYCVGHGRTGTHSMAGLFQRDYRSAHEPDCKDLIRTLLREYPDDRMQRYVSKRDRRLNLEFDSSCLNYLILDQLVCLPETKFILTVREPYSWIESCMNYHQALDCMPHWKHIMGSWFKPENFEYHKEEDLLKDRGLPPIDCYVYNWHKLIKEVTGKVPPSRLLIVDTIRIGHSLEEIANFLKIPAETLDGSQSHLYKSFFKQSTLSQLDYAFVEERIRYYRKVDTLREMCVI